MTLPRAYLAYLQQLSPQSVSQLRDLARPDMHFRDPFHDVTGRDRVERIFADMFVSLGDPRFVVTNWAVNDQTCLVEWDFSARFNAVNKPIAFSGASRLNFDENGLLAAHIDYWDASAGLYERIPALGFVLRRLRRRIAAAQAGS